MNYRRGNSCWLHPLESVPEVVQRPVDENAIPTFLGSFLAWSQQNYMRLLKTESYFEPRAVDPVTLPEEKRV